MLQMTLKVAVLVKEETTRREGKSRNSARYYCRAQAYTGVDTYRYNGASELKYPCYRRGGDVREVSRPKALEITRIHRATKVTVKSVMIGVLGTISKTLHRKLSLPDFFGSVPVLATRGIAYILRKVLCLKSAGSC